MKSKNNPSNINTFPEIAVNKLYFKIQDGCLSAILNLDHAYFPLGAYLYNVKVGPKENQYMKFENLKIHPVLFRKVVTNFNFQNPR